VKERGSLEDNNGSGWVIEKIVGREAQVSVFEPRRLILKYPLPSRKMKGLPKSIITLQGPGPLVV